MSLDLVLGFTQALALTMSVAFVTYVFVIVIPYLRRKPAPVGEPSSLEWHFFVPCRDEEAVIGDTIRYLRTTFPIAHVWVIDDGSDDRTAGVVRTLKRNGGIRDPQIHLVQRQRPYARTGKGNALNDAYRTLKMWMEAGVRTPTARSSSWWTRTAVPHRTAWKSVRHNTSSATRGSAPCRWTCE